MSSTLSLQLSFEQLCKCRPNIRISFFNQAINFTLFSTFFAFNAPLWSQFSLTPPQNALFIFGNFIAGTLTKSMHLCELNIEDNNTDRVYILNFIRTRSGNCSAVLTRGIPFLVFNFIHRV